MAAEEITQHGWAVHLNDGSSDECVAVMASNEETAIRFAIEESGIEPEDDNGVHVDGPYDNASPGYYEFIYLSEHRERVVVEAPSKEYAKEMADAERDYRGEFVQTIHTESASQEKDLSAYHESPEEGIDYEKEKERCRSLFEFEQ